MTSDKKIKLGYSVGYWSSGPPVDALEGVKEADRLGFDSVWTAEAYGSDCFTPLAWWGANTEKVRLGTGIAQISALYTDCYGHGRHDDGPSFRWTHDPRNRGLGPPGG